ncbi:MAG TPA: CbiX/SirB N-terminal domain-containing protein, partial [Chloroflexota bacterium]|nr:CbiX/SirB N-terminal domain-containing protein [Chloroflexota bacterium]
MRAAILLTRGIFADRQSDELERAVAVVRAAGTYETVVGAYVDHGTPDLATALDSCAATGATRILVAPIYAPVDRFLSTWIPQILRRWLRRRPQFRGVEVVLASSVASCDALGHAAHEALQLAEQNGGSDEIREDLGLEYGNPGFNTIQAYRYQALVCV